MLKLFFVFGLSLSLYACVSLGGQASHTEAVEEVQLVVAVELESLIPESESYSVVRTLRGLTLRSDASTMFRVGRADLLPQSSVFLDEAAAVLKDLVPADKQILIAGHSDNVGSEAANVRLSLRRAQSVMAALSSRGVDSTRMKAEGFGFNESIADNRTKEGQALNRRVEIIILSEKVSPQCRCMAFE